MASPQNRKMTRRSDNVQPNAVTPPPVACRSIEDNENAFPDLQHLCQILAISNDKHIAALDEFLVALGNDSMDDLVLLEEEHFQGSSLPPMIQKKLLLAKEFLLQGGSLEEFDGSIKTVVESIRSNAAKSPTTKRIHETKDIVIDLNVGGYTFTTTKDTLCRVPGSVLEGMFSGRHHNPAQRNKDGSYFIDRDGTHFKHILNFLRIGAVISLPTDTASKEALAVEADYYGLGDLVRAIRQPLVDTSDYLSDEVLAMRTDEDTLRQAFVNGSAKDFSQHRGLVSLFCPENGVQPLPLTYQPAEDTSDVLMGNLRKNRPAGTPVTAKSLEDFRSNFNREHPNVLHRLQDILLEEDVLIAGGSVLRALTSTPGSRTADWWGEKSDIDLFIHSQEPDEANRIARRIFFALAVDHERWVIVRSRGVITMHNWIGERTRKVDLKVQIVLRLYDSPSEVLVGFDCDCCCCAYDGESVWLTPRCLRALRTGVNIVNPLHAWPNKASYELRLAKYAFRGFSVVVPGLDRKLVDYEQILRTDLSKLKGLARLLKIASVMEEPPNEYPFWRRNIEPRHENFPQPLFRKKQLCNHVKRDLNDADLLIGGMIGGYDDIGGAQVLVPRVYGEEDILETWMWWYGFPSAFPLARDCAAEAWECIESAGDNLVPESMPSRLVDAWDTEKHSREYLNSEMDKFDLDNVYYGHAYKSDAHV